MQKAENDNGNFQKGHARDSSKKKISENGTPDTLAAIYNPEKVWAHYEGVDKVLNALSAQQATVRDLLEALVRAAYCDGVHHGYESARSEFTPPPKGFL